MQGLEHITGEKESGSEISLFELASTLLRRKKLLVGTVFAVMCLTALYVIIAPAKYQSYASILPSGEVDKMADLKSLAGLTAPIYTIDESSSKLFPTIIWSQLIQDAVLEKTYSFVHNDERMTTTLSDYFNRDNPDKLRKLLTGITSVGTDRKTGVIYLTVETMYPDFSRIVLNEYLVQLEGYNLHKRRSRAKENVAYLSCQVKDIKQELEDAEDHLYQYQRENRNWAESTDPLIVKQLGRLQREVEIKSQTYLFLVQEHEIAKLDAQKDIPIVRILDQPSLPTLKSGPRRAVTVLLAGIIAFIAVLLLIITGDALSRRSRGVERQPYETLRHDFSQAFPRSTRILSLIRQTGSEQVRQAKEKLEV
ncbi:MAG: hypothetical protein KAT58_00405 [candidate division Zixibacteria bacterium]|nr:hypothetical protein [candidate division Zixibacteria bacterium]